MFYSISYCVYWNLSRREYFCHSRKGYGTQEATRVQVNVMGCWGQRNKGKYEIRTARTKAWKDTKDKKEDTKRKGKSNMDINLKDSGDTIFVVYYADPLLSNDALKNARC
jgi:hypothetical protein